MTTWDGEVVGEEPVEALRHGVPVARYGESYLTGTLWALDASGAQAARLTFDVFPLRRMVLLGNIDADGSVGSAGDVRGTGAGRALMDALDRKYPTPEWWIAADAPALHSSEGFALMRSRRKPGRQQVHVADCPYRLRSECPCEFPDPPASLGEE
jgi:hypothetical protein